MNESSTATNAATWERWVRERFPRGVLVRTTKAPNAEDLPPNQVLELSRVWPDGRADVVFLGIPKRLGPTEWEFIKREVRRA